MNQEESHGVLTVGVCQTCYRQNCASRIADCFASLNITIGAPPTEAYENCLGCQHYEVCKDAEQKIAPCEHRLPNPTIKENEMRRVYRQVEVHGGIHHLIGIDQLALEGRLLILPKDGEKRRRVLQAIEGLGVWQEENV